MKNRRMKNTIRVLFLALTVLLCAAPAFAAGVSVEIPVVAHRADCTAQLETNYGYPLQALALEEDVTAHFSVSISGPGVYNYRVRVTDEDNDAIHYDRTVFNVQVNVTNGPGGALLYSLEVTNPADPASKAIDLAFTNTVLHPLPCEDDPPVRKVVIGEPKAPETFRFELRPNDPANPMPAGSVGGVRTVEITGAGEEEFGIIKFTAAGIYEYTATETVSGADGYTYDKTVYLVRYTITESGGKLHSLREFLIEGVPAADQTACVFTNVYTPASPSPVGPTPSTPQTGDDSRLSVWTTLSLFAFGGASLLVIASLLLLRVRSAEVTALAAEEDER